MDGIGLLWDFPLMDGAFDLRHLNSSSSPSGINVTAVYDDSLHMISIIKFMPKILIQSFGSYLLI
jgi:hypothetical protein